MKATKRLIDSVWTVEYNIVGENEVEIIKYSRDDEDGYVNEANYPQCTIFEDDKRTAIELLIRNKYEQFGSFVNKVNCDKCYKIINPKHIFNY